MWYNIHLSTCSKPTGLVNKSASGDRCRHEWERKASNRYLLQNFKKTAWNVKTYFLQRWTWYIATVNMEPRSRCWWPWSLFYFYSNIQETLQKQASSRRCLWTGTSMHFTVLSLGFTATFTQQSFLRLPTNQNKKKFWSTANRRKALTMKSSVFSLLKCQLANGP